MALPSDATQSLRKRSAEGLRVEATLAHVSRWVGERLKFQLHARAECAQLFCEPRRPRARNLEDSDLCARGRCRTVRRICLRLAHLLRGWTGAVHPQPLHYHKHGPACMRAQSSQREPQSHAGHRSVGVFCMRARRNFEFVSPLVQHLGNRLVRAPEWPSRRPRSVHIHSIGHRFRMHSSTFPPLTFSRTSGSTTLIVDGRLLAAAHRSAPAPTAPAANVLEPFPQAAHSSDSVIAFPPVAPDGKPETSEMNTVPTQSPPPMCRWGRTR